MRIAATARDLLQEHGIDVDDHSTGDAKHGSISIHPAQVTKAKKVLGRSRIASRQTAADTLELDLQPPKGKKKRPQEELDALVSAWRDYAKNNKDGGYRKACKLAAAPGNPIQAAQQIAQVTMRLAKESGSHQLAALAKKLASAAEERNVPLVKKMLADLAKVPAKGPKPQLRDPRQDKRPILQEKGRHFKGQDQKKQEQKTLEKQNQREEAQDRRVMGPSTQAPQELPPTQPQEQAPKPTPEVKSMSPKQKAAARQAKFANSAQDYLMGLVETGEMNHRDIKRLARRRGKVFRRWAATAAPKVKAPEVKAPLVSAWITASKQVLAYLKREDRIARGVYVASGDSDFQNFIEGPSDDSNSGFITASPLDRLTANIDPVRVAELVIEEYAAEMHPRRISHQDVEEYVDEHFPDIQPEAVYATIKAILDDGVPNRGSSKKQALTVAPDAIVSEEQGPTVEALEGPTSLPNDGPDHGHMSEPAPDKSHERLEPQENAEAVNRLLEEEPRGQADLVDLSHILDGGYGEVFGVEGDKVTGIQDEKGSGRNEAKDQPV